MKDREEFLASVYTKRDAELVKRKKYKKRVVSGLSAAAACLVLTVGLAEMDVLDFMGAAAEGSFDGAAVESITENEAASNSSMEKVDDSAAEDSLREEGAEDRDTVTPGAAPGQAAPPKDIYDMVTDENDSELAYYCLPRFTIEEYGDGCASATHGGSIADVEKVQTWVDELIEKGQAFHVDGRLEDAAELKMDEVTCIVTIEREPQQKEIYYLTGEVGWYE